MFRKITIFVFLIFWATAHTATADESLIRFPVQTFPAFAVRGEDFDVKLKGAHNDVKLSLLLSGKEYPLKIISVSEGDGDAVLKARVPEDIPFELYDLKAVATATDIRKRAVKIIPSYKKKYSFVHLTDTHFRKGENPYSDQIAQEINLINPEFVIVSGDVISNGEDLCRAIMRGKESYANYLGSTAQEELRGVIMGEIDAFFRFADRLDVPVFVIPGNHDAAGLLNPVCRNIWEERFSYRYFSFSYGADYFAGLDNSQMFEVAGMVYPEADKNKLGGFERDQLSWLEADLVKHKESKLKTLFFHCPLPKEENDMKHIIDRWNVNLVLIGHHHIDMAWWEGNTPSLWLMTRAARLGYRVIDVKDGKIERWGSAKSSSEYSKKSEPAKFAYSGGMKKAENTFALDPGGLTVKYDGANDGTRDGIVARIANGHDAVFENALLKLLLKRGDYRIAGGDVFQRIEIGGNVMLYVKVRIPAKGETEVKALRSD